MEIHKRDILIFIAIAYILAFSLDLSFYSSFGFLGGSVPPGKSSMNYVAAVTIWGLMRMYMPAAAMMIILFKNRVGIRLTISRYMNLSMKTLIWFILAPLFVLLSIGLYTMLASPIGIISFENMFGRNIKLDCDNLTQESDVPYSIDNDYNI